MTATDEIRKLLDECGVEWKAYDEFEPTTQWETYDGAFVYWARERDGILLVETTAPTKCSLSATPTQAIAATLGEERTCTLEVNFDASNVECSECHYPMPHHTNLMEIHYCPSCGAKVIGI